MQVRTNPGKESVLWTNCSSNQLPSLGFNSTSWSQSRKSLISSTKHLVKYLQSIMLSSTFSLQLQHPSSLWTIIYWELFIYLVEAWSTSPQTSREFPEYHYWCTMIWLGNRIWVLSPSLWDRLASDTYIFLIIWKIRQVPRKNLCSAQSVCSVTAAQTIFVFVFSFLVGEEGLFLFVCFVALICLATLLIL